MRRSNGSRPASAGRRARSISADGGYLLWSDIPNNRIMRWLEEDGHVSVFRSDSPIIANGNTRDREGRLVTCEHDARRVTRTEHDGRITVLMDSYQGKKLNAPNDVVVASDGAIWFTDPGYGIDGPYEGHKAEAELAAQRLSPRSRQRRGPRGRRRFRPPERPRLLARRELGCTSSIAASPTAARRTSGSLT